MGSRALKGRHGVRKSDKKTILLIIIAILAALVVTGCVAVSALARTALEDLPDYSNAEAYNTARPTTVYASDRETVLAEFQLENRHPVTLNEISSYVLEGTVATEDERFYTHNGVDFMGVARALLNNLMGGALEGASTITQQFVRNTILSEEMTDITIKRKLREMYISIKLEEQYEKDEILLMYLNTINYGSGAYGIEAAAERYFSKNADELSLAQAATLVGIPQSPTYNNPIDNPENCLKRRNLVLDRMVSNNYVTAEEANAAKEEPLELTETIPSTTGIEAYPYFTSYVRNQLSDAEGKYAYSTAEIFKGGLTVYTTLDIADQQAAEAAAQEKLDQVGNEYEVGLVAIDPDNGFIRAMIGGKDYDATQVNMATGEGGSGRQSGSAFKTFTLLAALEAGINPQTSIDASTTVTFPGWTVSNINHANYGTRSIASAFEVSSNTAFARLVMYLTPEKVVEMAHRVGITSDLPETGALTLGAGSVNPLEMADAYATIANGGIHYDAECIEQILDKDGNVVVDNTNPEGERVLSEEVACAAIKVMEGVVTRGTGTPARLANGQPAAGKTGTSENYMDSWFCGITPQMAVAIWMGDRADYVNAKPIIPTCTSVFSGFMDRILAGQPIEQFPTAAAPKYTANFSNSQYHIGGSYGDGEEDPPDEGGDVKGEPTPTDPAEGENPDNPDNPDGDKPPSGGDNPGGDNPSGGDNPGGSDKPPSGGDNPGGDKPPSSGGDTPAA